METVNNISVEEGDRLIAEFDGWVIEKGMGNQNDPLFNKGLHSIFLTEFPYHSSWDWLMPVVEKIGMLHWNDRQNNFQPTVERFLENDIEIIWQQVVQFIQWYNNQKQ